MGVINLTWQDHCKNGYLELLLQILIVILLHKLHFTYLFIILYLFNVLVFLFYQHSGFFFHYIKLSSTIAGCTNVISVSFSVHPFSINLILLYNQTCITYYVPLLNKLIFIYYYCINFVLIPLYIIKVSLYHFVSEDGKESAINFRFKPFLSVQ